MNAIKRKKLYIEKINPFFLVCARDSHNVEEKILELEAFNAPFLIVCGERIDHKNVVYRAPKGKWDAINFGAKFVPKNTSIVILNDVDTQIHNFEQAINIFDEKIDVVYCRVHVSKGPQVKFYKILDPIRGKLHIAASGELMLIRYEVWRCMLPVPPCIAEDTYILFKALELGYRVRFCTSAYVTTERTLNAKHEEAYKTRTTLGIYQALRYTKPPLMVTTFYSFLPLFAPLLTFAGRDGVAWTKGIVKAVNANMQNQNPTKF